MRPLAAFLGLLLVSACVPVPDELQDEVATSPGSVPQEGPFAPLDAGAAQLDSLHFRVKCYGQDIARQTSDQAEASYNRVMVDTNLFSFQPHGLYTIVVYGNQQEYRSKTHQPEWSGGVTVGNAIYTFYGAGLPLTVAHEMTHLIFHEFMGAQIVSQQELRWLNEGLAVYEEQKAAAANGFSGDIFGGIRPLVRSQPLPLDQIQHLVPASERERAVSIWYAQSESMVQHMLERGGRLGFSAFLTAIRDGRGQDLAMQTAFTGTFRDLNDFYLSWNRSILQ